MTKSNASSISVLVLVFLSGFTFLTYEVSWFRMLSLVLGATVSASTIVLTAFMAGFGLGAWHWGRKVEKSLKPGNLIFRLLIAIAALGIVNYFLISFILPGLYQPLQNAGLSASLTSMVVYMPATLLLFTPAFFMGGILPVAGNLIIRSDTGLASLLGKIYAWETLGSTLGGLATGFLLIGTLGQRMTIFVAVLINLAIAIYFLLTKSKEFHQNTNPVIPVESVKQTGKKNKTTTADTTALNSRVALAATFCFGFAVIGLQVVWIRILRIYLTNTSYTFSLIASMVILGLFAGSWFYMKRGDKFRNDSSTMLKLLLMTSLAVVVGFLILLRLPELIMFPMAAKQDAYFLRIIVIPVISSLLVIIPVTFISGYAFPLACSLYTRSYRDVSGSIGKVLLWNTAGSVIGPLMAAYLLIPMLGSGLAVLFFPMILLVISFFIAQKISAIRKTGFLKPIIAVAGSIILLILVIRPEVYILPPSFSRFEKKILDYHESVEGTYVVGEETSGSNTVLSTYVNNSAVIGSSYDAVKVVKMVGHLPFFAGLQVKNALVVGFGIGVTTSAIASHPGVEAIDCIELVSGLKDAAHYYSGLNNNIQNDKRLKIRTGDGRHFLQSSNKKYDLISSDPTHPILGSGNLYTKEYFELCKAHLNAGGMVSQYLPLHKLLPADFQGIIKTFHTVFPNSTIWLGHNHAVLLGANGPLSIDFQQWTENISRSVKDPYFYTNPYHLVACLVLDSTQISKFTADIKVNTDDKPYAEFFKLSSFEAGNLTSNLDFLNKNRCDVNRVFRNIPDQAMMRRFVRGNELLTEGVFYDLQGNRKEFLNKLQAAAAANPEDEEYPFLIQFNFGR
ncbi:MAG: fused MFS/spermidine synthase [Bacteroidales bacterium]|nr:fused MFS/spermidine synthase [Bacteroidales bacterium]